jgi:hypothetical protein
MCNSLIDKIEHREQGLQAGCNKLRSCFFISIVIVTKITELKLQREEG